MDLDKLIGLYSATLLSCVFLLHGMKVPCATGIQQLAEQSGRIQLVLINYITLFI